MYINDNIDVANCIANGAMCTFEGIILKNGLVFTQCREKIIIDGFYVNSIESKFVESLVVKMLDGNIDEDNPRFVHLKISSTGPCLVHFPMPWDGPINKMTRRIWRRVKFNQFPVNIANARTVHKLQGRSLKNVVISNWDNTGNWVYVVLSRCATLNGIYLRKPLKRTRPMSDQNRLFHAYFRAHKRPRPDPDFI